MSDMKTLERDRPEESEETEGYLRAIVEAMEDAVYVRDIDRTILYMNPAAERLSGWSFEESKVHPCYRIFGDPDQRCNVDCPIDKALAEGRATRHKEGTLSHRDGKVVPVEVSIAPLAKAGNARAAIIMRDIAPMRDLEATYMDVLREVEQKARELKQDEARFRDFADLSNEWLWETDADHRFTLLTGQAFFGRESYIGKRREELIDVQADKERWAPFFDWLANEQPFQDFVYPAAGPNGETGWVSISGKPVYDESGTFAGYRGIGRIVDDDQQLS